MNEQIPVKNAETEVSLSGLSEMLMLAPEQQSKFAYTLRKERAKYQRRLAQVAIEAVSALLFSPKKEGEPLRPAGNEDERKMAIALLTAEDKQLERLRENYESAKTQYELWRNRNNNFRLIARLRLAEIRDTAE